MISSKILGLSTTILVFGAAVVIAYRESCSEIGIMATGGPRSREFKICSKDLDNRLTIKTLMCGENSFFSLVKKRCVHNPSEVSYNSTPTLPAASPPVAYYNAAPQLHHHQAYPPSGSNHCPIEQGRFCFSCNTLVTCYNHQVVGVEHCAGCDPYDNKCTDRYIPECANDHYFYCTAFGLFPDPFFCNRFHFCLGVESAAYTFHCPPGTTYDGLYEECRVDPTGNHFGYYTPCPSFEKCTAEYQVGKMWKNAQYFYSCTPDLSGNLLKTVYRCDKNHRFNNQKCVPN